jgi:hypothetical protein
VGTFHGFRAFIGQDPCTAGLTGKDAQAFRLSGLPGAYGGFPDDFILLLAAACDHRQCTLLPDLLLAPGTQDLLVRFLEINARIADGAGDV